MKLNNESNMLRFAIKYPTWHSYASDAVTLRSLNALLKKHLIIINKYKQFKIK